MKCTARAPNRLAKRTLPSTARQAGSWGKIITPVTGVSCHGVVENPFCLSARCDRSFFPHSFQIPRSVLAHRFFFESLHLASDLHPESAAAELFTGIASWQHSVDGTAFCAGSAYLFYSSLFEKGGCNCYNVCVCRMK